MKRTFLLLPQNVLYDFTGLLIYIPLRSFFSCLIMGLKVDEIQEVLGNLQVHFHNTLNCVIALIRGACATTRVILSRFF